MISGRRSLLAVLQCTTAREVAARCGVVSSCVTRWVSGAATPSDVPRALLESIYGISQGAWDKPAVHLSAVRHRR